ncbi:MAG TPA: DUF4410 domain-containing protein [Candidatus Binatia bacterium]|jgi:hypothetical protein
MNVSSFVRCGLVAALVTAGACSTAGVRPQQEAKPAGLPRPQRILVSDLATRESQVNPNSSVTANTRAKAQGKSLNQRKEAVAKEAVDAFGDDTVEGLRKLGFDATRVARGTEPGRGELLIDGEFIDINEGSRLRRVVIGFGSGKSRIDAQLQVYLGPDREKLVDFSTHADSGELPGAAVTMTAGAVVTGGVAPAAVATNAAIGGIKVHRSATGNLAGRSGQQAVKYLSEYFAKQGWIAPEKSEKAKRE